LKEIALDIAKTIAHSFDSVEKFSASNDSFTLSFKEPFENDSSARELVKVIDKVLLLYIARCKK
jgi:hypothetical protein